VGSNPTPCIFRTEIFWEIFSLAATLTSIMVVRRSFLNLSGARKASFDGNIGFIGVGNMGSHMAMNLLKSHKSNKTGQKVFVFDKYPNEKIMTSLKQAGAIVSKGIEIDMVADCDVFVTMVPSSAHVTEVYKTSILPGLRSHAKKGALLIDCSTIDPNVSREVSALAAADDHIMIDAPVSGGIKGADNGTLTFMVGASLSENDFNSTVRPFFSPMGNALYCGGPGVGQSVKVCNNLILGIQMMGVAEGYRLAENLGVDLNKFNQIVNSSTGRCWTTEKYNPVPGLMSDVPASREYKGGFMTDLMIKDLGLALSASEPSDCPLPMTTFVKSEYQKISDSGKGALDFGCCYQMDK
jgi:3-hydroxyisobutyrate dehydrogenase